MCIAWKRENIIYLFLILCMFLHIKLFIYYVIPEYCLASLVAQLVKNPPAMCGAWVLSLDWEDPLEEGKATHSSILGWRIPWTV